MMCGINWNGGKVDCVQIVLLDRDNGTLLEQRPHGKISAITKSRLPERFKYFLEQMVAFEVSGIRLGQGLIDQAELVQHAVDEFKSSGEHQPHGEYRVYRSHRTQHGLVANAGPVG